MCVKMSTQAYYKERLGFDPQEVMQDGVNGGGAYYDGPHQPKRHRGDHHSETHDQVYEENLTKFKGTTCWEFFIQQSGSWWWVIENARVCICVCQTHSCMYVLGVCFLKQWIVLMQSRCFNILRVVWFVLIRGCHPFNCQRRPIEVELSYLLSFVLSIKYKRVRNFKEKIQIVKYLKLN